MGTQYGFVATEYRGGVSGPLDLSDYHQTAAGHFAALYRAGQRGQYAIKSFFSTRNEKTARDEYELLLSLNEQGCPNVPRAYCYGTFTDSAGEHPAFVMQYVDGKTLSAVIEDGFLTGDAKNPYLDSSDAARIALGIAKVLEGIAKVHVAQRDLSPSNLMITNRSLEQMLKDGPELYVVDFGQGTPTTRSTITLDNPRLSTVPYGAPEVFGGRFAKERNREQCDVWSLGALIFTMAAGEYWPAEIEDLKTKRYYYRDDLELIAKAKTLPLDLVGRMEAQARSYGDFEIQLAGIVSACTNYNPSYRPKLHDVIDDLEKLLWPEESTAITSKTPQAKHFVQRQTHVSVRGVPVRSGIVDYSWIELKRIARAIASVESDEQGLRIAREYYLADEDGKLQGDTKPLTLKDGTETTVRILGFRHDYRAWSGVAGITFEFADVPLGYHMNPTRTNEGGWKASEIRAWLNAGFLALMPNDIRHLLEPVWKYTNNVGKVLKQNDISVASGTCDRLWLLSTSEVYGELSSQKQDTFWSPATYDAEGNQYQFYTDIGVSPTYHDSCKKDGAKWWWWLRSPSVISSGKFRSVGVSGYLLSWRASRDGGVSPGFCF